MEMSRKKMERWGDGKMTKYGSSGGRNVRVRK
jgi:hypothetical protein